MFKFFKKFRTAQLTTQHESLSHESLSQDTEGWIYPQSATQLLNTDLRKKYLDVVWKQVSMNRNTFESLYLQPIERYAEIVQLLPASDSHHHAHSGGMLDHGLEVIAYAAKLRQSYVLPPNYPPEEQAKQRDVWTAVAIYSALVHDVGKTVVDIEITLKDGTRWLAWNGVPPQPYKFKYLKDRDYNLHPVLGGFFADQLIPKSAFDWIAQYPEAFTSLMYAISGHYDKAGMLSEIIQKADQHSVTLALGGDINKLVQRPVNSFAKQLVMALRHLLSHKIKLNTPKGPADGWFVDDALWLMSKTIADNIRTYLMEQGISTPRDNNKLFDEMQSLGVIEANPDGTAIWRCQIHSDGWQPQNTFTLVRIRPEVAWEKIEDRPSHFDGKVVPIFETETANNTNTDTSTTQQDQDKGGNSASLPTVDLVHKQGELPEGDVSSQDLTEQVLGMFEPANNNENAQSTISEAATVPISETAPLNSLTDTERNKPIIEKSCTPTGTEFVEWLKKGIAQNKFAISNGTAKLHIVEGMLFMVSPRIFEQFLQEMGQPYDKETITKLQYSFQSLGLHTPKNITVNGKLDTVNFWKCAVVGPRKTSYLNGYLLKDTSLFFGDKTLLDNLCLTLQKE